MQLSISGSPDPRVAPISAFQDESHQPFLWEGKRRDGDNGLTPAALLVHGFPGTPAEMRPLATTLHAAGWTVCGLLLPGFGSEIASLGQRSLADWTAAIRQAIGKLQQDHHPVLVVGHSMGGALSIQAAATNAHADGLILLAPFWKLQGAIPAFWPLVRPFLRQFRPFRLFKPDFDDPKVRAGIREFLGDVDLDDPDVRQAIVDFAIPASLIDHLFSAGRAAYACAPQITAPVLVMQGLKDPLVRPVLTQRLSGRFAGRVSYHELDAAHDLPHPDLPAWPEVQRLALAFAQNLTKSESLETMRQAEP